MNNKIDEAAIMWNKTKDPKYKDLWYKLIKEWFNGSYNFERRDISSRASNKTDDGRYDVIQPAKFFRFVRHTKTKTDNVRRLPNQRTYNE